MKHLNERILQNIFHNEQMRAIFIKQISCQIPVCFCKMKTIFVFCTMSLLIADKKWKQMILSVYVAYVIDVRFVFPIYLYV